MDPLSQAVLGAASSASFIKDKKQISIALLAGIIGGMAADLDFLISSDNNPFIGLKFHRHFTHSIFFIPFGGLLCALFLHLFFKKKYKFSLLYFYSTLGYATHGILDAMTAYGTSLFWPVYNKRIAFDNIAIIDPFFTLPILILLIVAFFKKSKIISRFAFSYALFYLAFGFFQHFKAKEIQENLANLRGHHIERRKLHPTIGNLVLWRSVYEFQGNYYVDAIWLGVFKDNKIYEGSFVKKPDLNKIIDDLPQNSPQRKNIAIFNHFTQEFIYQLEDKNYLADIRYGNLPNDLNPLWAMSLDRNKPSQNAQFHFLREVNEEKLNKFYQMLKGE